MQNLRHPEILDLARSEGRVIVTGGTLRRSDGGLVGHLASNSIRQFKFDVAVIGCSALDQDGELLDCDFQEVTVSQTILAQARRSILVADHSKFQRTAPARIVSLEQVDVFITDKLLLPDLAVKCREWQTEVIVAG